MIWAKRIGLILLIIVLGTVIDYVVHQLDPAFSVPSSYFPHKIFYGTLWGFVGYLVFGTWFKLLKTPFWVAFTIAAVPAVLLQTMYFIQGHQQLWVVFFFLVAHFFMFLLPGYFICKKYVSVFLDTPAPRVP